jgi:hypothetical protein
MEPAVKNIIVRSSAIQLKKICARCCPEDSQDIYYSIRLMKILDRDDPGFTLASHWQMLISYGRSIGLNISISYDRATQILPTIAASILSENSDRLALHRSPAHSLNQQRTGV